MDESKKADKIYAAMKAFRIYHRLSDERCEAVKEKKLKELWLKWRIDHNLPLKDEQWELDYDYSEVMVHCLGVYANGPDYNHGLFVGDINLNMTPPSKELNALLPKKLRCKNGGWNEEEREAA